MSFKRIVIIGPAYPLRGGLASYDERLATELQQQGHEVIIYTFSLQYPQFLFPGTTQFSSEAAPAHLNIRVCINSVNPFNWLRIGFRLKKEKPDLIIVRYWLPFMGSCLGTILRVVKKNHHTKIVCIADNIIPHEKRPGDTLFTRYFVKPVDAFITMSQKVKEDLKLFVRHQNVQVVPHPLYDNFGEKISTAQARASLGIPEHTPVVLFFGFIRKYKGLDLLLQAIPILQKQYPENNDIRFLIAGEFYEDRSGYEELIRSSGIENKLILKTDFIPDSEVKNYLCAADVVIQPYRHATQSGVTPLAYHFEVPMIVTNVGGLPDLVPDEKVGIVTEPNPAAIAEAIHLYFKNGKLKYLPGLVEEKKKYSWKILADNLLFY